MNRRQLILGATTMFTSVVLPGTALAEDESAVCVHVITTAHRRLEGTTPSSADDEVSTWRALDRADAAAERIAQEDQPPWPWVSPFDARKIAGHRLVCAVRLRRPDLAYAAAEDLSRVTAGVHRKQGALVLLDLASAHLQTRELDQALHVATAAVELAGHTRSERVISRARQFRRRVPARAPRQALGEFDERLRAALTRDRGLR